MISPLIKERLNNRNHKIMNKISYPINLTEEQYKVIENILEPQKRK
jgi:hypothetical protein